MAQQLGQAVLGRQLADELEVERWPGDGGGLGRRARLGGERRGAHQHRVADGVGHRHVAVAAELEAARARPASRPLTASARASSSTKNGTPCVRSWSARTSAGEGVSAEQAARAARRSRRRRAARARARRGGRRGAARCAASAACGRAAGRRSGRRRSRAPAARAASARAPASSSSVASSDHCRSSSTTSTWPSLATCANAQRTASKIVARSLAAAGSPSSGSSSARWARSGPQAVEPPGRGAQVGAQHGDDRAVRRDGAAARRAAQDERPRVGRGLLGEPGLADAGLAGEEQQRARRLRARARRAATAARARPHDRRARCVTSMRGV